jgi:hypothetical protein
MRRIDKTTQVIDDAIQKLFTHGHIIVPKMNDLKNAFVYRGRRLNYDMMIIDPDWEVSNQVQRNLFERIVRRIQLEHPRSIDINFDKQTLSYNVAFNRLKVMIAEYFMKNMKNPTMIVMNPKTWDRLYNETVGQNHTKQLISDLSYREIPVFRSEDIPVNQFKL